MKPPRVAMLSACALIALVWSANALTNHFHMVSVGLGLVTTAGTFCAGLTFVIRDLVHEYGGQWLAIAAIVVGSIVSAASSPSLAFASGVTFLLAEMLDLSIFSWLRRHGYFAALIISSLIGAVVDSALFLLLAGFPLTMESLSGQVLVKGLMIILFASLLKVAMRARAVPS